MNSFESKVVGRSVEGRSIFVRLRKGRIRKTVLILGGVHGDEPKSVKLSNRFLNFLAENPNGGPDVTWVILPIANPDGYARRNRRNSHRVDINRNFPTRDWVTGNRRSRMFGGIAPACEPETRAVMRAVGLWRPDRIVSVHSISGGRFCNNFDGPARHLAQRMRKANGYPVTASIGYATPGSFGTWAGAELGIPTVTLELPTERSEKQCWLDNREALLLVGSLA